MEIVTLLLTIIIFSFLVFYCLKKVSILIKSKKKHKPKNEIKPNHRIVTGAYNHVYGLSIPENAPCKLFIHDDKIVIESSGVKFNLYKDKILDVCIKTETEIQKQYVSSVGGAIAGGALFGPLGAIVGGRAKEKKSKTKTKYLIYTYEKDNEVDYISFDLLNGINSHKFISDFNYSNKTNKEINL